MVLKCKLVLVLTTVVWLIAAAPGYAVLGPGGNTPRPYIMDGLVTVVFSDQADLSRFDDSFGRANFSLPSLDAVLDKYRVTSARKLFPWEKERPAPGSKMPDYTRYYELVFDPAIPVNEVIAALQQSPHVREAAPVWALPFDATPNDPQFSSQWYFNNPNMNAKGGWDHETGSDSIIVAIVDSGVNYKCTDLKGHIWVNPGEDVDNDMVVYDIDDLNGIDDDGNGVVDDLIGYDFLSSLTDHHPNEDYNIPDTDPWDNFGHGTMCASIVAAMTNNSTGVAGLAGGWHGGHRSRRGVQIMCLRVGGMGSDGVTGWVNSNNCGTAMQYAARNGAKAINCSWGSQSTPTMNAAMALIDSAGVTVAHAAGNDNVDEPGYLDYDPLGVEVLSVASVQSNDQKSSFSNFGYWVDVSAYGDNIFAVSSSWTNCTTESAWGTSFSSPMVVGLAALIRSAMPSLTKEQVDSIIINTTDNIDAVNPSYVGQLGSGRIDINNALSGLALARFSSDVTEGEHPLTVNFTDQSPNSPISWNWSFGTGDGSLVQNPSYTYTQPGLYDVSLTVDDAATIGLGEEHLRNYIWVRADTVRMDSIMIAVGGAGVMNVHLANTTPLSQIQWMINYTNEKGIELDSFSVAGTRTSYFNSVVFNLINGQWRSILMTPDAPNTTSHYLQPGSGTILKLYFRDAGGATPGSLIAVDTISLGNKTPRFTSIWGNYVPVVIPGKIYVQGCGRGDTDCSHQIDIQDLLLLVNYMFNSGPPPNPFYTGDVDGNGVGPNIEDLLYLVNYMFNSGPPPPAL